MRVCKRQIPLGFVVAQGDLCSVVWLAVVGATGFEPATTWSQTRSATGLRYTPHICFAILRLQR